jgi:hypothetical protein
VSLAAAATHSQHSCAACQLNACTCQRHDWLFTLHTARVPPAASLCAVTHPTYLDLDLFMSSGHPASLMCPAQEIGSLARAGRFDQIVALKHLFFSHLDVFHHFVRFDIDMLLLLRKWAASPAQGASTTSSSSPQASASRCLSRRHLQRSCQAARCWQTWLSWTLW